MLRTSGGSGRTRAGWRRRREALNPSQASLSLSTAFAWRREGLLLEICLLYKFAESTKTNLLAELASTGTERIIVLQTEPRLHFGQQNVYKWKQRQWCGEQSDARH